MKRRYVKITLFVIWSLFVLIMTTQSERMVVVEVMSAIFGRGELIQVVGHIGLFSILTGTSYGVLRLRLARHRALILSMLICLLIGTITEVSQLFVADRSFASTDLLANWLGTFKIGGLVKLNAPSIQSTNSHKDN